MTEGIFRPSGVYPLLYALIAARCQTVECHTLFLSPFIQAVNLAKLCIACLFQVWRYQQQCHPLIAEYLLRQVVAAPHVLYHQIWYLRHIALFRLHRL